MTSLTRSVTVHAPVDEVYAYLDDPRHEPEFYPSEMHVSDVQDLPNGGHSHHWLTRDFGITFEGDSEDVEHVVNERIATKSTMGGVDYVETWTLEPHGDDTKITFDIDYTARTPVIGKLVELAAAAGDSPGLGMLLDKLKDVLEAA